MPSYSRWMIGFGAALVVLGGAAWFAAGLETIDAAVVAPFFSGIIALIHGALSQSSRRPVALAAARSGRIVFIFIAAAFVWLFVSTLTSGEESGAVVDVRAAVVYGLSALASVLAVLGTFFATERSPRVVDPAPDPDKAPPPPRRRERV